MTGPSNDASSYRVEISGWDENENFFVERANLEWLEADGKRVALRSAVRQGSLVFVRLLDSSDPNATFPVAYRADSVRAQDNKGEFEISLARMWPRDRQGS
jgi:hypothetical protein